MKTDSESIKSCIILQTQYIRPTWYASSWATKCLAYLGFTYVLGTKESMEINIYSQAALSYLFLTSVLMPVKHIVLWISCIDRKKHYSNVQYKKALQFTINLRSAGIPGKRMGQYLKFSMSNLALLGCQGPCHCHSLSLSMFITWTFLVSFINPSKL